MEILKIDRKSNECHRCGADKDLIRHEFAIAKVVSVKREWTETLARVGISAVSIVAAPITGFGVFSWKGPNKTTSYRLIHAELVLCRSCLSWGWKSRNGMELKDDAYRYHPWAVEARRLGYEKYLSSEELKTLKPIK
jgi:ribosomal protein S14